MTIKIILAEDHEIMRKGLHGLISRLPGIEVISTVSDGKAAVETARRLLPDLVLMDIRMPIMDGIEATRQLKSELADIKVLCLSMHRSESCVHSALQAGASGYLLKNCAVSELDRAIRAVYQGKTYVTPTVAGRLGGKP